MNRMRKIAVMTQLIEMLRDKQSWCGETHVQKAIYFAHPLRESDWGMISSCTSMGHFRSIFGRTDSPASGRNRAS